MSQTAEWTVQVLAETNDGREMARSDLDYVEGAIQKMFPSARGLKFVVTITDENESVLATKYLFNPTEELRERAWK